MADPKDLEEERKRQIVREVFAKFDDSNTSLFQFIYDNGEISVKALAQTQKFGRDLYRVLDRAHSVQDNTYFVPVASTTVSVRSRTGSLSDGRWRKLFASSVTLLELALTNCSPSLIK
ncbi:MAG: hypothetical protein M3P45_10670 [Acidobacteriota bacterium]|nr:hypothetical protein [Acidobacteriota bacterium]